MWQVEDIIRAYGCQLSRIKNEYIARFADYTDEQRAEMVDWYGALITMMNSEGKREGGHLAINQIVVKDMNDLHNQLLQSSRFRFTMPSTIVCCRSSWSCATRATRT